MSREMVASFLFTMPILIFAVPSGSVVQRLRTQPFVASAIFACALGSAATFCLLLFYYRAVSRYLFEFTPLLFPLILCNVAIWWENRKPASTARKVVLVAIALVFVANVFAGICLGLNGMAQ